MSLLEANQAPPSKTSRYVFMGVLVLLLIGLFVWRAVRYEAEEKTVETFFNALTAGNMQQAYQLWKAMPSYSFQDFEQDWGPSGYYGPVKSFQIDSAFAPKKSTSVAVRVLISPYEPFPKNDPAQQNKTKEIIIWVDRNTQSLSFPPPAMSQMIRAMPPPVLRELASRSPA
ncbi:MAG TPA: hypothetical protein VMV59_04225 [Candidatus Dormibacteraeota bacterium]|nr:hypothetical protein [Candidatus Dormibacteraeota bacterium]